MIEIIPNWHPIFVHFTIALLSMAVLFYGIQAVLPEDHHWQPSISLLAKANLWIGMGFALITALAGWFAYNSVAHDTPSHIAMTVHRNWALVTLGVFFVLTLWSIWKRKQKKANILFVIAMFIAGGLLASTGWHGAESVYRYGLGVMSLPKSEGEGHAHEHAEGEDHGHQDKDHNENTSAGGNSGNHTEEVNDKSHTHSDTSDKNHSH